MKKLFLLSVWIFAAVSLFAQEPIFYKGDKVANLGIGLGYNIVNFSLSGELGVKDGLIDKGSVGLGGVVGLGSSFLNSNWSSRTTFGLAARGTFHYPFIEKLDTYAGLALGLRYDAWKYLDNDISPIGGFFLGGRYYFSDKMAFFGEVGAGIDYLTVGIAFKL